MDETSIDTFEALEMRTGRVERAEQFPEAQNPAYQIWVDFGEKIGTLKTSAQVTAQYEPDDLVGRTVVGLVNLPDKQIGPFTSEFLLMGAVEDDGVRLLDVDGDVKPGTPIR